MFISGFMKSSNECWQSREIQKALPPIMSVEQQPFVFPSVPGALVRRLLFLYPVDFYVFVFIFGWGSGGWSCNQQEMLQAVLWKHYQVGEIIMGWFTPA